MWKENRIEELEVREVEYKLVEEFLTSLRCQVQFTLGWKSAK